MLQKLLHKHLTNLGLNYIEVLYLFEFINRHKIVYKSDFYKICEFKIRDKDRDEYSMKKKNTGKYNDIYHDRHFKHGLTTMFLLLSSFINQINNQPSLDNQQTTIKIYHNPNDLNIFNPGIIVGVRFMYFT